MYSTRLDIQLNSRFLGMNLEGTVVTALGDVHSIKAAGVELVPVQRHGW